MIDYAAQARQITLEALQRHNQETLGDFLFADVPAVKAELANEIIRTESTISALAGMEVGPDSSMFSEADLEGILHA